MKKLLAKYNPRELAIIIKIMEAGFEEARPSVSVVMALHRHNYKIIKLTPENCLDYQEKDGQEDAMSLYAIFDDYDDCVYRCYSDVDEEYEYHEQVEPMSGYDWEEWLNNG